MNALAPNQGITNAYVVAAEAEDIDPLMTTLAASLFSVYRMDTSVENLLYYVDLGTAVMICICAVSLIVSAMMIYIVMNISVTERTREIGILRAIGGRTNDVRRIFIFESGAIGAVSGLIACAVAAFISIAVSIVLNAQYGAGFISGNPLIYLGGLLISIAVSVLSGLIPANTAGGADPVEALRGGQ
jgi:ABC-type antimicrobial peptide transport system permease subunit